MVCLSLPLLLIAPLLGVRAAPADAVSAALFVLSLALGIVVGLLQSSGGSTDATKPSGNRSVQPASM